MDRQKVCVCMCVCMHERSHASCMHVCICEYKSAIVRANLKLLHACIMYFFCLNVLTSLPFYMYITIMLLQLFFVT